MFIARCEAISKEHSGGDVNFFLFSVEGRQEIMTRVWTIMDVVSESPPAVGHIANTKVLRQCRAGGMGRGRGRGSLDLSTNFGSCRRLLMQLDVHLDALRRTDEEGL